ncbi:MAG: hypothetical protein WBF77_05835 [Sulfurimonadaceae bacterium]
MKEIIKELSRALQKVTVNENSLVVDALMEQLNESNFSWVKDLPISIVHKKEKLKDPTSVEYLLANDFFDDTGCSGNHYELSQLKSMHNASKSSFQTIDLAVLTKGSKMDRLEFQNKRPNDFWKRLQNIETIEAMIGLQHIDSSRCRDGVIDRELEESSNGQWSIESDLRDAMRSKKENSGLRAKPFIWVVTKQPDKNPVDHIEMMLRHYFGENVVHGRGKMESYIGYMDELDAISLREFYKKA